MIVIYNQSGKYGCSGGSPKISEGDKRFKNKIGAAQVQTINLINWSIPGHSNDCERKLYNKTKHPWQMVMPTS